MIVVLTHLLGSNMVICCGAGLNLSNQKPLPGIEILTGSKIAREVFLAEVFNHLETKLYQLKDGSWRDDYYSVWCHKERPSNTPPEIVREALVARAWLKHGRDR